MWYCGNSFSAKYLITNIAGFNVGDIVVVKTNRDGGRNVSCWLIVREIIPTTKGQGYLRIDHSSKSLPSQVRDNVPFQANDWIAEGDFIAKAPDFITVGNIVGPFVASTFNGVPISYYQPEDNFDPTRHQIFNYSLANPTQIVSKNTNVMSNTEWSGFDYSGICFYERVYDKPRGGWNSLGNRIATLLSRQHILVCDHYRNSQRTFTVTDGSSFYTRQARQGGGFLSGDDFTIPPGSPGNASIGSGFMQPGQYPTWFALQNPGKDITDIYPDIPINEWSRFIDSSIIAFKTPVPENATMLFALNKNKYRFVSQFVGFYGTNTYTGPSPLVIGSSFHTVGIQKTGSLTSTMYGGGTYSSATGSASINQFPWDNKPLTVNYTDFLGSVADGDSGSILMFKYIDPNNNTKFVFGGQTANEGSNSNVTFNSSGVFQSCVSFSGYPTCSINNLYSLKGVTQGFGMFDDITYKIIKIILDDKSWQITAPNRIIANNPELNIVESDLIQTYPRVVEIDSLIDKNTYISQFQALSLSSGVNYFGSQKVFTGVPTETIFRENGTDLYTFENETYPEYTKILDDWYTGFAPLVDLPVFYKLSPTDKLITDTTVNPNEQKQIFKHGGDLTGRLSLEEINKSYNTSGMIVYKTKK